MTTDTEQHPTWGEEPPARADAPGTGWNGRKTLAAVAVAVGIAAVGGGVIYAAGNSDAARGLGPGGYGMRPGGGLVIMGGPFGDAQHGEFQNGEVTEVDADSVTVRSGDGFSKTYTIDGDTRVNGGQADLDDVAAGDVVTVLASAVDGVSTADNIMEGDMQRGGPRRGDGQPPDDELPADRQDTPRTR
ncbi:hypothetical protein [Saccharothrix hoggarensis]|uniref:DUF5666 domain-containing protein n=1 Tax=Saccharothrix hoggarensis TaxID=913853 RepID=A0ABW3QPS2_9PSEU